MKNGQKIQADYYAMAKKLARDVTFSGATQKNRPIIIPSPKNAREITMPMSAVSKGKPFIDPKKLPSPFNKTPFNFLYNIL